MFQLINNILHEFREKIKREKTWRWFVIIVLGFMLRSSKNGVTSIIGAMRLKPRLYHTMLHFFRSTAYKVEELYEKWVKVAIRQGEVVRKCGRLLILGDHSKVSKEGLRMPGVEILQQDSQNSGKAEYIMGHNYGQVSAVITNGKVSRSLPLVTQLQKSPAKNESGDSLVVQMLNLVVKTTEWVGEPTVVALDAYFSSERAWSVIDKKITSTGERLVEIVTRAQKNTVAYSVPQKPTEKKRGQPRKYGEKIVLSSLFADMSKFTETTMELYGKQTKVKYLCLDLIWRPVKKLVRFVLVESDSGRCILMSSNLTFSPEDIITVYALRFKIEPSFAEQKNDVGCFDYHFWTSALPKRKKWGKSHAPANVNVDAALRASQSFVCLSTIATGLLSLIAFSHNAEIWQHYSGWIKTVRSSVPSIAIVKSSLSACFHDFLPALSHFKAFAFIIPLLRNSLFLYRDVA